MIRQVFPGSLSGTLRVMPSKSASHRAVMMAALCGGSTTLAPLQLSADISATLSCARALGLIHPPEITAQPDGFVRAVITADGTSSADGGERVLDCGESGSTLRFFIPLALDGRGPVRFVGHGRLMQRPLDLYRDLFASMGIRWQQQGDSLWVDGMLRSGTFALRGDVSSQFITGLLLALPRLEGDSRIVITTPLQSRAYVELTRGMQAAFGIVSHWDSAGLTLAVPGSQQAVSPGLAQVEGDWSHAAFYLTAGVLSRSGPVTLTGLDLASTQGDRAIVSILRSMGARIDEADGCITAYPSALHGETIDCAQVPDLVPILAVAMASACGESRITNAARLRIKESDRLTAMQRALSACGVSVTEQPDGLFIRGGSPLHAACIDGCNDHRIVMAMSIASALCTGTLSISDAEACAKSAPAFFTEFASLGGHTA